MPADKSVTGSNFQRMRGLKAQLLKDLAPVPIAFSVDGKSFGFEAPLTSAIPPGSYVEITVNNDTTYFGQILERRITEREGPEYGIATEAKGNVFLLAVQQQSNLKDHLIMRKQEGGGLLLGSLSKGPDKKLTQPTVFDVFDEASMSPASNEVIDLYFQTVRPKTGLDIGTPILVPKSTARVFLNADGFDRHTLLTGQSRCGKSFALGVILEQLMLSKKPRLVVIDPNSDFVRLDEFRDQKSLNDVRSSTLGKQQYEALIERYREVQSGLRILRHNPDGKARAPLQISFSDLSPRQQPAVLKLDPLADRDEFHSFQTLLEYIKKRTYSLKDVVNEASRYFFQESRNVGLRIVNSKIADWGVWSKREGESLVDVLRTKIPSTVVDIGSLNSPAEKAMISMVVLEHFWENRRQHEEVLIIIDEAHNVCPLNPADEIQRICRDLAVLIAGEGLKYGIYLLLATQRPDKLDPNVMSQCENQIVMKMTSRADLARIADTFSQVSPGLLSECAKFDKGYALIAGKIVNTPTFVHFDGRLSFEGGGDLPKSPPRS
jgi:uncharacterized protein